MPQERDCPALLQRHIDRTGAFEGGLVGGVVDEDAEVLGRDEVAPEEGLHAILGGNRETDDRLLLGARDALDLEADRLAVGVLEGGLDGEGGEFAAGSEGDRGGDEPFGGVLQLQLDGSLEAVLAEPVDLDAVGGLAADCEAGRHDAEGEVGLGGCEAQSIGVSFTAVLLDVPEVYVVGSVGR